MNIKQGDPKRCFRVDVFTEHKERRVTVKGVVENQSDRAVCLKELTALYKNFDGFVVDVDKMKCKRDLTTGERYEFAFAERNLPINCYFTEVMVSKFSRSDTRSSDGTSVST